MVDTEMLVVAVCAVVCEAEWAAEVATTTMVLDMELNTWVAEDPMAMVMEVMVDMVLVE